MTFKSFCLLVSSLVLFFTAEAHVLEYGALRTELQVEQNHVFLQTEVPQRVSYGSYYSDDTPAQVLEEQFERNFSIWVTGTPCTFQLGAFDNSDPDRSFFSGTYACEATINDIQELRIHNAIFKEFFIDFDHYVTINIGPKRGEIIFTPESTEYPEQVQAHFTENIEDRFLAVAKNFTQLGVVHILTGYDHVLFLLSIIILLRSIKKILILVTSFTVAHTITLILATLDVIAVPSALVEPLIALTILYVAARNLITLKQTTTTEYELTERWFVIFTFGLVHGLGFAGILAEMDLPQAFFVPSLVFFSIGIEAGQVLILSIIVPILFKIDTSPYRKRILVISTMSIGALALFWFFERISSIWI